MNKLFLYSTIVCLVFFSCKKNKDDSPPVITISAPLQNSTVNAGTYIHLKGHVMDDKKLAYVKFSLIPLVGGSAGATPIDFYVSGNMLNIDQMILVGDIHTEGGIYQIVIEAFDGTNKQKAYCDINVVEIPRVFKKMIVVRDAGSFYSVDSLTGSSFVPFITGTTDFYAGSINNYDQQLYLAPKTSGPVLAYDLITNSTLWSLNGEYLSSPDPIFYFNEYNADDKKLWLSMAWFNGKLKSVSNSGDITQIYNMQADHYASAMLTTGSSITVAEESIYGSGDDYLSYYSTLGSGLLVTTPMPLTAMKLYEISSHQIMAFGNYGTQGELRVFDALTFGFTEPADIPAGKIYDVLALDAYTFIISHENGLYTYNHLTTSLTPLVLGGKAQKIVINPETGILYSCEGNVMKGYNPYTGAVAGGYVASDSVRAVLFHYNK